VKNLKCRLRVILLAVFDRYPLLDHCLVCPPERRCDSNVCSTCVGSVSLFCVHCLKIECFVMFDSVSRCTAGGSGAEDTFVCASRGTDIHRGSSVHSSALRLIVQQKRSTKKALIACLWNVRYISLLLAYCVENTVPHRFGHKLRNFLTCVCCGYFFELHYFSTRKQWPFF